MVAEKVGNCLGIFCKCFTHFSVNVGELVDIDFKNATGCPRGDGCQRFNKFG